MWPAELKMSELKQSVNKSNVYRDEKSEYKFRDFYFPFTSWTGIVKRHPYGDKRALIVHPTSSIVLRLEEGQKAPTSVPSGARQQLQSHQAKTNDQWVSSAAVDVMQRTVARCQAALAPEKCATFFHKFAATAGDLGINLTTDFVPRFTAASAKVAGACGQVAVKTYDKIHSLFTKP